MKLRQIVMNMRLKHNIKGKFPVVVFTIPNDGKIYSGGKNFYVLTYREKDDDLYFHHLTKYLHKYDPKKDFSLRIDKFRYYSLEFIKIGGGKFILVSYKDDYFPFGFFTKSYDSKEGENNLQYIIDELKKYRIQYKENIEHELKNKKGKKDEKQTNRKR